MAYRETAWGLDTLPPDTWLQDAVCKPETAELFWPVSNDVLNQDMRTALAICGQCPVIVECGQYAIDNGISDGVWGGMRPDQLRRLSHGKPGVHTAKTHCPFGHEYTEANTYLHADGKRRCRKCKAARSARSRELRAELTAARPGWRKNIDKSKCWRGHPFDEANTYTDSRGRRLCRACRAATTARYHARKKAAMSS